MRKNVASQKIAAHLVSKTDGSDVTTGTTTVYVTVDGGTQATTGTATHKGNGEWSYAPSQAETNGNHVAYTFVNPAAVGVTVNAYPVAFDPSDATTLGLTNLDAAVSSRMATFTYTTPPTAAANATATRTELATELGRIDATISSRAPASTALSNLTWTTTQAGFLDAAVSSRMASFVYTPPPSAAAVATATRTELATELGRIDAAVSTRALAATALLNTTWTDAKAGFLDVAVSSVAGGGGGGGATASEIAAEVWATAPAGTPVEDIAAAVWAAAPAGTPVEDIAAAVWAAAPAGVPVEDIAVAVWAGAPAAIAATLVPTGLDAISLALAGVPATFRERLVWLCCRHDDTRKTRVSETGSVILVRNLDGDPVTEQDVVATDTTISISNVRSPA